MGVYRDAIAPLDLGDVTITEIFDPTFGADQNVAMIRIQAQEGQESVTGEVIAEIEAARAPFIAAIDADDVWHPTFLTKTHRALVTAGEVLVDLAHGATPHELLLRLLRQSRWCRSRAAVDDLPRVVRFWQLHCER